MKLKTIFALVTLVLFAFAGALTYSHRNSQAVAKPSPSSPFKTPVVDGMWQGDTEELLVSWNKAQVEMSKAQNLINDYVTLMNAKVKKNGIKEGTQIEFISQNPCIPTDAGRLCDTGVRITPPAPPAPPAAPAPTPAPATQNKPPKK